MFRFTLPREHVANRYEKYNTRYAKFNVSKKMTELGLMTIND